MKTSSLFQLIQKLTPEDRRGLDKFVQSPFHNQRKDVVRLFHFIIDHMENSFSQLTYENGFAATYPTDSFDLQKLRYCMSYLTAVIEQYLIVRQALSQKTEQQIRLAKAYRKLELEKPVRRSLERGRKLLAQAKARDTEYYERSYQLEAEALTFSTRYKRTDQRNFQEVNHLLDLNYLAKKLRDSCVAISHEAVANVEAICATPGLDGIYIGPADLTLGVTNGRLRPGMDRREPEMIEVIQSVLAAAKAAGIRAGIHCGTPAYAVEAIGWGFDMTTIASDVLSISHGAANAVRAFHEALGSTPPDTTASAY